MENQTSNLCCGNSKTGKMIMAVLLIALSVYVLALALNAVKSNKYIGRGLASQNTISVSGNGDVSTKPDLAVMSFSVVSEGKTVAEAMSDNTKKMNAVIDAVKKLGVEDKDLQTTGFNINPRYDYVKQIARADSLVSTNAVAGAEIAPVAPDDSTIYYPNGKRVLTGYEISQSLTVKMRDLTKIGQIIEGATNAGANQTNDLQFTLDDPDAIKAQARQKAIDDAKSKAQVLAKQLGVKLVRIVNFSEGGYYPSELRMNYAAKDMAGGGVSAESAPSIQTGENKVTINVSIVYEIE